MEVDDESGGLLNVQPHPAAELFPLMEGAEFERFVRDIAKHGVREPLVLTPDGQLLDGRNRWRAVTRLLDEGRHNPDLGAIEWRIEHGDPWSYALSANLHRRHLNDSQRAMVAEKIGKRTLGRPKLHRDPDGPPELTLKQAGELLHLPNPRAIDKARVVRREGIPSLVELVERGKVGVYVAARIAASSLPPVQAEFVRKVQGGMNPTRAADALGVPSERELRGRNRTVRAPVRAIPAAPPTPRKLTEAAVRQTVSMLQGLEAAVRNVDGVDPSISPEQAAGFLRQMRNARGPLRRVQQLLTQRKESTT